MKTTCPQCGVRFGSKVLEFRRKDGQAFWCPNGHSLSFRNLIEADQKAVEEEQQRTAREVDDLEALYEKSRSILQRVKDVLQG